MLSCALIHLSDSDSSPTCRVQPRWPVTSQHVQLPTHITHAMHACGTKGWGLRYVKVYTIDRVMTLVALSPVPCLPVTAGTPQAPRRAIHRRHQGEQLGQNPSIRLTSSNRSVSSGLSPRQGHQVLQPATREACVIAADGWSDGVCC